MANPEKKYGPDVGILRHDEAQLIREMLQHHRVLLFRGEKGSGKSTLSRSLARVLEPEGMVVRLDGHVFAGIDAIDRWNEAEKWAIGLPSGKEFYVIDSMDYLYREPKHADQPSTFPGRARTLMERIEYLIRSKPEAKFIFFIHDENWDLLYKDYKMRDGHASLGDQFDRTIMPYVQKVERVNIGASPKEYPHIFKHYKGLDMSEHYFSEEEVSFYCDFLIKGEKEIRELVHERLHNVDPYLSDRIFATRVILHIFEKFPRLHEAFKLACKGGLPVWIFRRLFVHRALQLDMQTLFSPVWEMNHGKRRTKSWGQWRTIPDEALAGGLREEFYRVLKANGGIDMVMRTTPGLKISQLGSVHFLSAVLELPFESNPDLKEGLEAVADGRETAQAFFEAYKKEWERISRGQNK
jgi:energy-coupling factor transporter ATP-binding protein EcfA2